MISQMSTELAKVNTMYMPDDTAMGIVWIGDCVEKKLMLELQERLVTYHRETAG